MKTIHSNTLTMTPPVLWREINVPEHFCITEKNYGDSVTYGGDIRLGDLRNCGLADFLVYRSVDVLPGMKGGMKPCFLGAFTADGKSIWSVGEGGFQPCRPGPVAIHDINGDGKTEVICFFHNPHIEAEHTSMSNVLIQIRDGASGELIREAAPARFRSCRGNGPNWVHQRILIANFRGKENPQDFLVKLGASILAFDANLEILWEYKSPWTQYGRCPAYIPTVGDIDGDGKDEVNGGYFLLDHDGAILWEKDLAPHTDSVIITPWDDGRMRAVCSGYGYVLDMQGETIMKLGNELVPHGQEVRVGSFRKGDNSPQMVIRSQGHNTDVLVVDVDGRILNEFNLNSSPNNTGMEVINWNGKKGPSLLYNGGMLWDPIMGTGIHLPDLPPPALGEGRKVPMAWYHCIPADVCGDEREEVIVYNPWSTRIYVYTQNDNNLDVITPFKAGPRQYNVKLMD